MPGAKDARVPQTSIASGGMRGANPGPGDCVVHADGCGVWREREVDYVYIGVSAVGGRRPNEDSDSQRTESGVEQSSSRVQICFVFGHVRMFLRIWIWFCCTDGFERE